MTRREIARLSKMVKWYNQRQKKIVKGIARKKKPVTRSDIVRMMLEAGAPIVREEFRMKWGDEVPHLPNEPIAPNGWQNKPKLKRR